MATRGEKSDRGTGAGRRREVKNMRVREYAYAIWEREGCPEGAE